jgi:protein-tyrosine phosphatase
VTQSKDPETQTARVLFVCMGNICRSPTAEAVLRKMAEDAGVADHLDIDSCGTIDYHVGKPPDERMVAAGQEHGYRIEGKARCFEREDLDRFDLIVTMDEGNHHYVNLRLGHADKRARLRRLTDFCHNHPDTQEVPDPYYGGSEGFTRVVELLEDGCAGILDWLRRKDHLPEG